MILGKNFLLLVYTNYSVRVSNTIMRIKLNDVRYLYFNIKAKTKLTISHRQFRLRWAKNTRTDLFMTGIKWRFAMNQAVIFLKMTIEEISNGVCKKKESRKAVSISILNFII